MRKESKLELWILGILIACLVVLVFIYKHTPITANPSFGANGNAIEASPTLGANTVATVTSTASAALAARNGVQLRMCTNSGNADITLGATTTNLAAGTGFVLRSSSSQVWAGDNLWTGVFYAITASGSTSTLACAQI